VAVAVAVAVVVSVASGERVAVGVTQQAVSLYCCSKVLAIN